MRPFVAYPKCRGNQQNPPGSWVFRLQCERAKRTLWETSRWLKRWMLDKARDVHFALVLSCLGKIIRRLHS